MALFFKVSGYALYNHLAYFLLICKPPGRLLATDRSKAMVLVWFLLNVFGVGVSSRKLYYFVVYLYVDGSGSITSVGEERANLSAVVYL